MKLGNIITLFNDKPLLEILERGNRDIGTHLYIMSSTGYGFQVTGINSNKDYGSSNIHGLDRIIERCNNDSCSYLVGSEGGIIWMVYKRSFQLMICDALRNFADRIKINYVPTFVDISKIKQLASETYKWVTQE